MKNNTQLLHTKLEAQNYLINYYAGCPVHILCSWQQGIPQRLPSDHISNGEDKLNKIFKAGGKEEIANPSGLADNLMSVVDWVQKRGDLSPPPAPWLASGW